MTARVKPLPTGSFLLLLLFIAVIVTAVAVVFCAHWDRELLNDLHAERAIRDKAQAEWGRLILEQSTWTAHSRIEFIAAQQLKMRTPDPGEIKMVTP